MEVVYESRWYWVEVWELKESEEPDFSKVPEARRSAVLERWREKQMKKPPKHWRVWGPQIAMFLNSPVYRDELMRVIGPVGEVAALDDLAGTEGDGDDDIE